IHLEMIPAVAELDLVQLRCPASLQPDPARREVGSNRQRLPFQERPRFLQHLHRMPPAAGAATEREQARRERHPTWDPQPTSSPIQTVAPTRPIKRPLIRSP